MFCKNKKMCYYKSVNKFARCIMFIFFANKYYKKWEEVMNQFLVNMTTLMMSRGMLAEEYQWEGKWEWVGKIINAVNILLYPLLVIVGAAGMIYAIVIGVQMARADSTEKREEAKKRLINVIVGLAIIIGLILFFKLFIEVILPAFVAPNQGAAEV